MHEVYGGTLNVGLIINRFRERIFSNCSSYETHTNQQNLLVMYKTTWNDVCWIR